jgi:D-aminopeptidase
MFQRGIAAPATDICRSIVSLVGIAIQSVRGHRDGVERALNNLDDYEPYKLRSLYTLVLTLKTEQNIYRGSLYPGAKRTGDWELTYVGDDVLDIMNAYRGMRR